MSNNKHVCLRVRSSDDAAFLNTAFLQIENDSRDCVLALNVFMRFVPSLSTMLFKNNDNGLDVKHQVETALQYAVWQFCDGTLCSCLQDKRIVVTSVAELGTTRTGNRRNGQRRSLPYNPNTYDRHGDH